MKLQHSVVEFARSCRRFIEAVEIAEILPRLRDVAGIVVIFRDFMPGDNRSWSSLSSAAIHSSRLCVSVSLGKIRVDSIVDDVSRNDQADRWNVQAR